MRRRAGFRNLPLSLSFLVKVKLSLLLLYDGKAAVFSEECGSFSMPKNAIIWVEMQERRGEWKKLGEESVKS
ncbi:MAG: hypothetical protein Q4D42_12235 [Eubacteriales bacterium]|nr:hypothetical protein [Eubacteriales bacterium]